MEEVHRCRLERTATMATTRPRDDDEAKILCGHITKLFDLKYNQKGKRTPFKEDFRKLEGAQFNPKDVTA
jgi:hypothetical protein